MPANAQLPTKPHYPVLDGLRGIAAFTVVAFHLFEPHSTSHLDQIINHGYLAVDFFFLLSGFVVAYAYDDQWQRLTIGGFFKRRLVRLQPMVIAGMVIGAVFFYFQDSPVWPAIHQVPVWQLLLVMIVGFTLIPMPMAGDIRGWQEMHPLNGPGWSLFFEYVANIFYALFVRRFSKTGLGVVVVIAALLLVNFAVNSKNGDLIGGWSLDPEQLRIGFTRTAYPFFAGLLLSRIFRPIRISQGFGWSSLLLLIVLAMPRIGGPGDLWMNGWYDSLSIIFLFPVVVYLGASSVIKGKFSIKVCKFLGDISYPLYITHYPLIYTYTAWVSRHKEIHWQQGLLVAVFTYFSAIAIAYACLKWYDEPLRRYLRKKLAE